MRKAVSLLGMLMLAVFSAVGQDKPKVEVFGGYSYAGLETGIERLNLNGWGASVAVNPSRWLGLVADFSGQYGTQGAIDRNAHSFLFGPRFSHRGNERFTPFAHALFGATRVHNSGFPGFPPGTPGASETGFSMALGGGLDVRATKVLAFRVAQADYLMTRFDESSGIVCIQISPPCPSATTGTQHNFRFAAGVVLRF